MKTVVLYVRVLLAQVAQLDPIHAAALANLVVQLLPFVHVNTGNLAKILAASGLVATWLGKVLSGLPAKVAERKAAAAPPA